MKGIETVRLKNGATAPSVVIIGTMPYLKELARINHGALEELAELAKYDLAMKTTDRNASTLLNMDLVEKTDSGLLMIKDDARDIVNSAVEGEGFHIRVVWPVAERRK